MARTSARTEKHGVRGEKNGSAKLTNDDVVLMFDFYKSCEDELDKIELEIERLTSRKRKLRQQMTRKNIADMFEISVVHCERIFRGEARLELLGGE